MSSLNEISTEQLRGEGEGGFNPPVPPLSTAEPVFVNVYGAQESIPPTYVAWRAGTTNRVVVPARAAGNRFLGYLRGLQIRAQASGQVFKDDVNGFSSARDSCLMSLPEHAWLIFCLQGDSRLGIYGFTF
jgi:hypothetical protein